MGLLVHVDNVRREKNQDGKDACQEGVVVVDSDQGGPRVPHLRGHQRRHVQ